MVLLKDVALRIFRSSSPTLEGKWETRNRDSSASLQSQPSGWTGVLDWHCAFTEARQEQGQEGWLQACTTAYWTSLCFLQQRETYQILQPPRQMDKIAQRWFMKSWTAAPTRKLVCAHQAQTAILQRQ